MKNSKFSIHPPRFTQQRLGTSKWKRKNIDPKKTSTSWWQLKHLSFFTPKPWGNTVSNLTRLYFFKWVETWNHLTRWSFGVSPCSWGWSSSRWKCVVFWSSQENHLGSEALCSAPWPFLATSPGRIFMEAQCAVGPSWLGGPGFSKWGEDKMTAGGFKPFCFSPGPEKTLSI